ncbi:hypothetical protein ACLO87_11140 [Paenalcaligenes sp. Me52]|uniref:hypothetical protein n=1 Tax=Paenalcaligenes sp. Me52 TaxID=3392038 RepID=UPI003D273DA0
MNAQEYMEEAYEVGENSVEGVRLIEQAIKAADADNDVEAGYEAREMLMDATYTLGMPKKQLLAFAWMIKQFEDKEIHIDEDDLMWKYKWVALSIVDFPEISKAQIDNLLEDMKQKYLSFQYSLKPYYKIRTMVAMSMGEPEEVLRLRAEWQAAKQDHMNDCAACETNDEVHFQFYHNDHQAAVTKGKPLVSGRQRCGEVPHLTNGMLALSFWALGNKEAAQERFERGYKLTKNQVEFLNTNADFILYLMASDQWQEAENLATTELKILPKSENKFRQFRLYAAVAVLLQAAKKRGLSMDVGMGLDEALQHAQEAANAFDTRNGNNFYQQQLAAQLAQYA